jgi:hypothetical protein
VDYQRIYAAFIADRQGKPPSGYGERHHIFPRCLGGGDEPANLIDLTPEDHFFAHLCLAKIHGGKLWSPVAFMVGGSRKDYIPTQSRKRYGWVKRALARSKSGRGAYQFDYRRYELRHVDGREWAGLQSDMPDALGIDRPLANMLVKGRAKSAKGWYLAGKPKPEYGGSRHPMYRSEVHEFINVDGRSFTGTQHEFHLACGVSKPAASNLARRKVTVWNGWHLKGADLPKVGRASRWRRNASAKT